MKKYKIVNKGKFCRFIVFLIILISIISIRLIDVAKTYADSYLDKAIYQEVYIESGDTLWNIAKENVPKNKDVRKMIHDIQQMNNLNEEYLQVGTIIKIPNYK